MDIKKLTKIILFNGLSSTDSFGGITGSDGSKLNNELVVYIQYEFVFLYIHLTSRELLDKYGDNKRGETIDEISNNIVNSSISVMYANSSDTDKERIKNRMVDILNEAEIRYGTCKKMVDRENPFSEDSVFGKFGKYILFLIGKESDLDIMLKIIEVAISRWLIIKKAIQE